MKKFLKGVFAAVLAVNMIFSVNTNVFADDIAEDIIVDLGDKYAEVKSFSEGLATVVTTDGKYGVINSDGEEVIVPTERYGDIGKFQDGMATFKTKAYLDYNTQEMGEYGFLDTNGKEIIVYEGYAENTSYVKDFSNGYAQVFYTEEVDSSVKFMHSLIDTEGNVIFNAFDLGYNVFNTVGGNIGPVSEEGLMWVVDSQEGGIRKAGFINTDGEEVIPFIYDDVSGIGFQDGIVGVEKDGKWGYINTDGEEVIPFTLDVFFDFSEGMAGTIQDNKAGYMDESGNIVIPHQFDAAWNFAEGLAKVRIGEEIGYIDNTGEIQVPLSDYTASSGQFYEGYALVGYGEFNNDIYGGETYIGTLGLIDTEGNEVFPIIYDDIELIEDEDKVLLTKDGRSVIASIPEAKQTAPSNPTEESDTDEEDTDDTTPVEMPETVTASPTTSKILVDGIDTAFDAYLINGNNYFKLRDVAKVLNGTASQFEVTWDSEKSAINMTSDMPYTEVGGEMTMGDGTSKIATLNSSPIYLDGEQVSLTAYTIGGNNFFKLRDLGQVFDFDVSWENSMVTVDSDESYTED